MQNMEQTIAVLELLANGTDPVTNTPIPAGSSMQHPVILRALFNAVKELKISQARGNQGNKWSNAEEEQLRQHFNDGKRIIELARIHGRTTGAIKSRLIRIGLLEA
ncbi:hypothetical protein MKQ68_02830 [Chitinophaga horti]|uniref:Uncharacterized protein n=1 Tax=Chitinophaga horti TaxID=2920382 RepID=A0ABY6J2X9_9BACT|nr:hypothetical protein [Chitinophaga horti]UYQ94024.1 hypothetical protein MKQ68_02830 [Chitinophaga horti]